MDKELADRHSGHSDEDEELMPARRAFFGIKFHDEESQKTAQRVAIASITLGVFVILHFIFHVKNHGKVGHAVPHLLLGLGLPWIGYRAATLEGSAKWRPRLLWLFHLGNVLFLLVHILLLVLAMIEFYDVESFSADSMCDLSSDNDPALPPADARPRVAQPTMPPDGLSLQECIERVNREKADAPGRFWLWVFLSFPYWACAAYAAYYSHELYLQVRIRELTLRRGGDTNGAMEFDREQGLATVGWADSSTAVE